MKTQEAFLQSDYQWVLEFTDQLLLLPNYRKEAMYMKSSTLWSLGLIQGNAPARNYYLTQALEVDGKLTIPPIKADESIFLNLEIMTILKLMAINLNPEKVQMYIWLLSLTLPILKKYTQLMSAMVLQ